jgi:hypothetical protein
MADSTVHISRLTHLHVEVSGRDSLGRYRREYVWAPSGTSTTAERFTRFAVAASRGEGYHDQVVTRGTDPEGMPFIDHHGSTHDGWFAAHVLGCDSDICQTSSVSIDGRDPVAA